MQFLPPSDITDKCTQSGIDPAFSEIACPFMVGVQTTGPFGTIISQHYSGSDYAIYQHHFIIEHPTNLYAFTEKPILSINYMLQGTPMAVVPGIGTIPLKENTYQLFYVPTVPQEVWFEKGTYHCMHIVFNPLLLHETIYLHPSLEELLDHALRNSEKLLPYELGTMDFITEKLLSEIKQNKKDSDLLSLRLRSKVLHLFIHYIQKHYQTQRNPYDRTGIALIKDYIDANLDKKLTLPNISRMFGLSPSTLRRKFKSQYNTAIFSYIQLQRMEMAMELLNNRLSNIAEISYKTGYSDPSAFTHAFKNYFGYAPTKMDLKDEC